MQTHKRILKKDLLLSTISFDDNGSWVRDSEFFLQLGTGYLLAHGLGERCKNAKTTFYAENSGSYHIFAYTYNWVAPWHKDMFPGEFRVVLKEQKGQVLGHSDSWAWEYAGEFKVDLGENTIELEDLTGFEGRCALLYISKDNVAPNTKGAEGIKAFYQEKVLSFKEKRVINTELAIIGGGFAGMCTSLAAARSGVSCVLVQDRAIVGGNNSSEVRVWLGGGTNYDPYPGLGNIVGEFEQKKIGHYGPENKAELYEDDKKMAIIKSQENLTSLFECVLLSSTVSYGQIKEISVLDYINEEEIVIKAPLFCDATGDGNLGALSGADFEVTTNGHMGASNLWHIEKTSSGKVFPPAPWAVDLKNVDFPGRGETLDIYNHKREKSLGCWFWESGMTEDPIVYAERTRDMNFRAMYGAWDTLKNVDHDYKDWDLVFASAIAGKRESRRLLGDVVLTKADFAYSFIDGCIATTWNFDVHYPDKRFYAAFHEGDAFLTMDCREVFPGPYFLPYRILYSRNIENMFMAGRCASTSHDASGTVRVMRTGGMMGEAVGYAASLCKKYNCLPRDIYTKYLKEYLSLLSSIEKKEVEKVGNTVV